MLVKFFAPALMAVAILAAPMAASAQEDQALTQKQAEAVRNLVRDYIMENPEIIAEAIEALREKQRLTAEAEAKKALVELREQIRNDPDSPVLGNAKGDITVVEFFDYRCTYCKAILDPLMETVKADGKVRLVMKEFPILGPDSVVAAKAAMAARAQKKYEEFHRAMMKVRGQVNTDTIFKVAAEVGLNVDKLKKDMSAPEIDQALKRNAELARSLDISGTPALIIGDRIIPGALDQGTLKQIIDQTRKTTKG